MNTGRARDGLVCIWCKQPFVRAVGTGNFRLGVCKSCISNPRPVDVSACCCSKDKNIASLIAELDRAANDVRRLQSELEIAKTISEAYDKDEILRKTSTRKLQEILAERWQEEQDEWDD